MAEQKAPNWKDHLSSIPTNTANAPYKSGTKTLGAKELAAANKRHAAEMALQREKLALSQWETQMRHNLSMMEFQALQADRARGWDFADRELALKYRDPVDGGAGGGLSGANNLWNQYYSNPNHQSLPKPQVSNAPSMWEHMF